MVIAAVEIKLYLPWVHSLKEKRMAVKSILQKHSTIFIFLLLKLIIKKYRNRQQLPLQLVTCTVGQAEKVLQKYYRLCPRAYTGRNHKYR